jgi:hypothetical protein
MLTYRLKSALVYLGAILVAGLAWVLFYRWLLGSTTQNFVTDGIPSPNRPTQSWRWAFRPSP